MQSLPELSSDHNLINLKIQVKIPPPSDTSSIWSNMHPEEYHKYRRSSFLKKKKDAKHGLKLIKNEKLIGVPASELYKRAHLCMDHFEDWCFMNVTKKHP